MSIVIGARRILIGGPFRGLMKAVLPQERYSWVPFGGIVNYAQGRITPVARTTLDLLQKKDFYGQKIGVSEGPRRILDYVLYAAEGMLPITLQEVVGGLRTDLQPSEIAEQSISQLFGWNMFSSTPYQRRDAQVKEWVKGQGIVAKKFWDLSPSKRLAFEKEKPELFEAIKTEVRRRAKFGDLTATRQLAAEQVREEARVDQEGDDADFRAKDIGGKEWRERRRTRMEFLSGQRDQIYKDVDTRDPKTPTDFYYAKLDELREVSRGIMTDQAWDEMDAWIASLPSAEQQYIHENTLLSPLTPLVGEYYKVQELLGPYWEVGDDYGPRLRPVQATIWQEWQDGNDAEKLLVEDEHPGLIRALRSEQSKGREALRRRRPEIDAALIRWGYAKRPLSKEGLQVLEERKGRRALEIPSRFIRVQKPDQTPAATPSSKSRTAPVLIGR